MDKILKFLRRVAAFVGSVFGPDAERSVLNDLETAYDILDKALVAVEKIATLTPTKADDEIIRVARQYSVSLRLELGSLTDDERRSILRTSAAKLLADILRAAGFFQPSVHVLNIAIELAYSIWKARQGGEE